MSERSGSTWIQLQQHDQPFHTVLLRCSAFLQPWPFKHPKFLWVCVYHLNPFTRFTVFNDLCLFTEFNSMTYDNVDLQIGGKKNQSSCSKTGGRGVACMTFALCSRAIFLSSWPHFGKKKVIFTSGNLANWMANSLFMVESPITFTLRDPCTRSLRTF